jgi:hypothetical protein
VGKSSIHNGLDFGTRPSLHAEVRESRTPSYLLGLVVVESLMACCYGEEGFFLFIKVLSHLLKLKRRT